MATMMEKKEQVATWNGDPTTWLEYVKRVRLQFERTEKKRRCLLGAELASRLTGRAWDIVSAEVDHSQLQKRDGAAYLLRFLEERLCKAPVPDTGQRLEDFFLRLRRTPGSSMAEWATQVRESYRRLQRAMARQRKDLADRDGQLRERAMSSTHSNPGHRRQSDVTTPKAPTASVESASPGFPATDSGNGQTDRPDDPRETDEPDRGAYENRHWRRDDAMSWTAWEEDEEEDPVIEWEQFDLGSERILPDEILGWILLRRSGLPANARLSVLSATNNRLDLASMERAMRDQEEELLAAEAHRSRGDLPRPCRSFWVEEDAHWGLLSEVDIEDVDDNVFWVGERLPPDVYSAPADEGSAWSTWLPDGQELSWEWHEDDFYASDAAGIFWSWSETKTWLDMCDAPTSDGDPLQEAYAAFQDRFRTFKESRALNSAKHLSRGFYPLGQMKGKFMQAKGKGKGKSKTKNPPNSSLATSTVALYAGGAKGAPSGQKPAPARSLYAAAVFMVSSEQADEIADVTFPTGDVLATLAAQFPGHAVLDSGATESIASLEAMHEVMELRASIHGPEHFVVHAQQKRFRFGNGSIQHAVSFVELPQIVAGKHVKLGVHALDAPGIPLLLSVKTLTTLRAVIDFDEGLICFKEVDPSVWIKLKRASNGHLLLDLTKDWLSDRPDSCLTVHDLHDPEPAPMYKAALADDTTSCEKNVFENVHTTPPTLQEPLHDRHERMSHDVFDGVCHEESHAVFEHVLPALATTPVPKTTTKKKGTRVPTPEKYDMSRREGPDGRDSRAQGFPCYGNHTPMPEGRGSLSGRNGHGKWTVCTLCRLRIEYVPAYGAKGCYRQPGPLAPDVTTVMEQVKDDIKDKPEVRENLNMKMASTLGAEASLRKKLEVLENDKIKLQSKARARPEAVKQEQDVVLNASAPKKTLKRENVQESEEQETAEWEKIYGKLTPLQQESLVTSADHYQQEAEETFEVLFNTSSQDTEEIIAMIHDLRPKMMWISLPCGPYSPIQHIFNQATPEQEAALLLKKKRSRKLTRNALRLVKTQLEEGGHVCWEWPQNNGGWRLPELKVLYDLMNQFKETHHAHIHGCAFGVKNAVGVPLKKPWKVVCTSPSMAAALTRRCPGNHEHAECIGGQDARNSGFYPEAMCRTIFRTVQSMNHSLDGGAFAESFPIFDDTLMEDEKELNLEKPLSDSERKMAMQTLAKLHRRTGHPSNHALSGCLKHRGAHHEVIEMAKKYQCPECQELRLAELNPSGAWHQALPEHRNSNRQLRQRPRDPEPREEVSLSRLARDPRYTPEPVPKPRTVPELFEQPIFKKQRRLHQSEDEAMMVSDTMTTPMEDLADYACVLYLDLPSKANEWRKMRRTPINYFVKKVRGAEIQWHKLDPTEKKKFMEAKHLEVQQWLTASAVKRITGDYPKDRLAIEQITYTTKNEHEPLTKDEMSQLRGALGALQWRAQQTAPHLMARLGQLQSSITKANIETIKATNKLIRENFQHRYLSARINQLGVEDPRSVHFVAWSDAALANRIDLSSTGGFLIAATSEKMLLGERAPLTLVSWRSSRLARKARSSLAAETQAMSEADQELLFVRLAWAEFCAFEVDLKASEKAISQIPGTVVTDAKALFDILLKSDLNSAAAGLRDKYSALEVLCLLESLAKLGTKARWVHSDQQLADHLTKPLPAGTLHKVLSEGAGLGEVHQGGLRFKSSVQELRFEPSYRSGHASWRFRDIQLARAKLQEQESETPSAKPRVGEKVEVFSNSARRFFGTSLPSNWTLEEVEFYDRLFADLNSKSDTCSSRPDTGIDPLASLQSEYLEQCGLPRRALREIWQVANPHLKTSLGLEEFRASCRLVGHCQAMSLQDEKVFRRLRSGGGGLRADLRSHCLGEPPVRLPDFTLKEGSLPASAKNSRKAFGETGSNSSWFLMVHACSCILQIWSPGYTILHNLCDLPLGTQTGWSRPAGVDFSICRQWRDSAG
ncbi:unnamed protein product [Durusdinium trenchii]|uniref:EH domain-containing protein n=1 Tax=Durusdinium trenchii TaxID=1381693 RepID=A0ABP0NSJ1_9DINO